MATTIKKKLTPRTATTDKQLSSLPRDNTETDGFWIMVGADEVTLCQQRTGEAPKAKMDIPKRDFNRFVDFYNGLRSK